MSQQRPADGDALFFAAGQGVWPARQQMVDAEEFDHGREVACRAVTTGGEPASVEKVLAHAEMGEEAAVLEDVADAATVLRDEHATLGVDQGLAIDRDPAAVAA